MLPAQPINSPPKQKPPQKPTGNPQPYQDQGSGLQLASAFVEIDSILYKPYQYVLVIFNVYDSQRAKDTGMAPVFSNVRGQIQYNDDAWDLYFDPTVMDQPNSDILSQAITWAQANLPSIV